MHVNLSHSATATSDEFALAELLLPAPPTLYACIRRMNCASAWLLSTPPDDCPDPYPPPDAEPSPFASSFDMRLLALIVMPDCDSESVLIADCSSDWSPVKAEG